MPVKYEILEKLSDDKKIIDIIYRDFLSETDSGVKQRQKYQFNIIEKLDRKHNYIDNLFWVINKLLRSYQSMAITENGTTYHVVVANSKDKIKLFIDFIGIFSMINSLQHVGFDFEFNHNIISLSQLSFYPRTNKPTDNVIWIIDPRKLSERQTNFMVEHLYLNNNIHKIVHGAESLDFPYIFKYLFKDDKHKIQQFVKHSTDTRFLCEFHKIMINYTDNKCSIYDAMLFFKTITKAKYDELSKIDDKINEVGKGRVDWNIDDLDSYKIKYALYDVLFLKQFLFDIVSQTKKKLDVSIKLLTFVKYIYRLVILTRWDIDGLPDIKNIVTSINNYSIMSGSKQVQLFEISDNVIPNIRIKKLNIKFDKLLKINFFKNPLIQILKYVIYSVIQSKTKIYKHKSDEYKENLGIDKLTDILRKIGLSQLSNHFLTINRNIISHIRI